MQSETKFWTDFLRLSLRATSALVLLTLCTGCVYRGSSLTLPDGTNATATTLAGPFTDITKTQSIARIFKGADGSFNGGSGESADSVNQSAGQNAALATIGQLALQGMMAYMTGGASTLIPKAPAASVPVVPPVPIPHTAMKIDAEYYKPLGMQIYPNHTWYGWRE